MKILVKLTLTIAALMMPAVVLAQSAQEREIADAVLKVYDDELRTDPTNYEIWFRRANLLYGLNQYSRALSDIDNALKYTPQTDLDMLAQGHALRANIYIMSEQLENALADISRACEVDPSSYEYLYQKANIEYQLEKYQEAKEDFRRLGRIHNRSLESLVGLSRIAVKENNLGLANEYIDQAVQFYPAEPEAYLRRASVRQLLGNNVGAVDDMIMALSLDSNSQRAISAIVAMSNSDYNAVVSALSHAITEAPNNGMFYYIRATIAQAHHRYLVAIDDYRTILDNGYYNYYGINASMAECYYALCEYDKALNEINYAIGATADNGAYYVTLSKIRLAMGDVSLALDAANKAFDRLPDNNKVVTQLALCEVATEQFDQASNHFGELIINMPNDPVNYIMRGWVLREKLQRRTDAVGFLTRCAQLEYPDTDINSMRGFALLLLGQEGTAREWIDQVMAARPTDVDGRVNYLAACLYSHLGETDLAFDYLANALDKGYSNLQELTAGNNANINIAPLRDDPRFAHMIKGYDYLFKK